MSPAVSIPELRGTENHPGAVRLKKTVSRSGTAAVISLLRGGNISPIRVEPRNKFRPWLSVPGTVFFILIRKGETKWLK